MIQLKSTAILIFLLLHMGCAWFDKSEHVKIVSGYEIGWDELVRNRCITKPVSKCDGCFETIVENYVYAVGHNDEFIIAKQHPGIDTLTINYFIIDIKENERASKTGIYGPLSLKEFDSLSKKFKISELRFDLNYPENP